jgi:hypothetical protein
LRLVNPKLLQVIPMPDFPEIPLDPDGFLKGSDPVAMREIILVLYGPDYDKVVAVPECGWASAERASDVCWGGFFQD